MTGAVIPAGADGVVMLEHTRTETNESGEFVHISATARPGMNLQRRGDIIKANHLLLPSGRRIRAIEIGLLAEFGVVEVDAFPVPQVGILPTGDELVDFTQSPSPGRIRNSNGPLLDALVRTSGAEPVELGIGPDRYDDLSRLVERGLQTDILVLSGGVSMGQKDLVPQVLRDCGVRMIFHRVRLRPGKPAWFGILDGGNRRTLVFGLPGNPVSTLVCFLLLVRPAIHRMLGFGHLEPFQTATLAREHTMLDERPTLFPARRVGVNSVETLAWRGSSDQVTMTDSDCLVFFRTPRVYPPGDVVEVLDFDAPHGG
jgi:molybdopterin molybdotransferase